MDKRTALEIAKSYAELVKKEMNPLAIVLYGSYNDGIPHEDSDIDIAVVFDGFDGDILETSAKLYQYTCEVNTIIEPILLDISNDKTGFVNDVMSNGYNVA